MCAICGTYDCATGMYDAASGRIWHAGGAASGTTGMYGGAIAG